MSNPTARERAIELVMEIWPDCPDEYAIRYDTTIGRIERIIAAAEQAAREDERRKVLSDVQVHGLIFDRIREDSFRRGAEAMRERTARVAEALGHDDVADRQRELPLDQPAATHADAPEP